MGIADDVRHGSGHPLMRRAVTHRSHSPDHNENLEFLGDAVIELVVTEILYRNYKTFDEGRLAKLRASVVDTEALARLARQADLGSMLKVGTGAESTRTNKRVLASTFEAVLGAQFLLMGLPWVKETYTTAFVDALKDAEKRPAAHQAKTLLQETAVAMWGETPFYTTTGSGPHHKRTFETKLMIHVPDEPPLVAWGSGQSKKDAEQRAAWKMLEKLGVIVP